MLTPLPHHSKTVIMPSMAKLTHRTAWLGLLMGCIGWLVPLATPSRAAERVYISYGILERSIPVASLEKYAKTGTIDDNLAVYAQYADAAEQQQLKAALLSRADINPVTISQFLYTPQGEVLLKRLGEVIQSESRVSGFKAIRAALILAASDSQGLTLLNVLRQFPTRGLRIDVQRSLQIVGSLEKLVSQTKQATRIIKQESQQEASADTTTGSGLDDLRQRGPYTWQKQTFTLVDPSRPPVAAPKSGSGTPPVASAGKLRGRVIPVDLYLPRFDAAASTPAPVVVISHGLGSDRETFAYLAKHLASYGFAVLVPEHPGSNAQQLQALIDGTASEVSEPAEFVDRPLDITYLLNAMEQRSQTDPALRGKVNLQQVGVLGQSFGGYTSLALAGAPINGPQLQANCKNLEDTLNLSLLLQCRALQLGQQEPTLQDKRVKAAIAINPITSAVFGKTSISQIKVPTLILTGNGDTIAPALWEQIQPFTWLTTANRYLVLMESGTHFSTLDASNAKDAIALPDEVVGPNPLAARRYINALSVAFFQTYIANKPSFRNYLSAAYIRSLSDGPLPLSLVKSLTSDQLVQESRTTSPTAASALPSREASQ